METLVTLLEKLGKETALVIMILLCTVYVTHTMTLVASRMDYDTKILDRDMDELKTTVKELSAEVSKVGKHLERLNGRLEQFTPSHRKGVLDGTFFYNQGMDSQGSGRAWLVPLPPLSISSQRPAHVACRV